MAFQVAAITGVIDLDANPAIKALKNTETAACSYQSRAIPAINSVQNALRETANQVDNLGSKTSGLGGMFDRIAASAKKIRMDDRMSGEAALQSFTSRGLSGMADLGLSKAGLGAPGMIISGIAQGLNEAITKAMEFSGELEKGNVNAADISMSIGKSLPVLGEVFKLGETINDAFTGQKTAIKEMAEQTEHMNAAMQFQQELAKTINTIFTANVTKLADLDNACKVLNATLNNMPTVAAKLAGDNSLSHAISAENDKYSGDKSAMRDAFIKTQAENRLAGFDKSALASVQNDFNGKMRKLEEAHQAALAKIKDNAALQDSLRIKNSPAVQFAADLDKKLATMGMSGDQIKLYDLAKMPDIPTATLDNLKQKLQAVTEAEEKFKLAQKPMDGDKLASAALDAINQETKRALQAGQEIAGLQKELEQIGMTDVQKRMADIKGNPIFTEESMNQAKVLLDKIEAANQAKAMDDKIKSFRESIETPMDRFQKQVDQLAEWESAGKITASEFDQGAAKASKDAFGDAMGGENKSPQAVLAGSYESQRMMFENAHGLQPKDEITKKQLTAAQVANNHLSGIARDIRVVASNNAELVDI